MARPCRRPRGARERAIRLAASALVLGSMLGAAAAATPTPLFALSDFGGVIPYSAMARMCADRERDEVYVLESNVVRVFNAAGMEVYRFGHDVELGSARDIAVDRSGDIYLLCNPTGAMDDRRFFLARCDYRGGFLGRIEATGLPPSLRDFSPNALVLVGDRFLLASARGLAAVELGRDGRFERAWDLAEIAGLDAKQRESAELGGFSADGEGNLLFTIPVLFRAFVVSADGTARAFGRSGSGAGMFGITGGIVRGDGGMLYVADRLRGVVVAFREDLSFAAEFGAGQGRDAFLAGPANVLAGARGKIYVTQTRGRGISVFAQGPS